MAVAVRPATLFGSHGICDPPFVHMHSVPRDATHIQASGDIELTIESISAMYYQVLKGAGVCLDMY